MDPSSGWTIFIPLVASLLGAGVGALTAQHIAARNKRNDERVKEIRAASAAVTIAYGITDHLLGMKHQVVKPVVDRFMADREIFEKVHAWPRPPSAPPHFFKAGLQLFRFNWSAHKELQDMVFDDVSPQIRPMMILPILSRTLNTLDLLSTDRNAMLKDFIATQKAGKEINPFAFYGVPFPTGGADESYADTLKHIVQYTDDAIIFSKFVGDDLREYSLALRQTLPAAVQPLAPALPQWTSRSAAT